jgi:hypothetical protein
MRRMAPVLPAIASDHDATIRRITAHLTSSRFRRLIGKEGRQIREAAAAYTARFGHDLVQDARGASSAKTPIMAASRTCSRCCSDAGRASAWDQTRREHAVELQKYLQLQTFGLADWRSCLKAGADAAWATDRSEPIVQGAGVNQHTISGLAPAETDWGGPQCVVGRWR